MSSSVLSPDRHVVAAEHGVARSRDPRQRRGRADADYDRLADACQRHVRRSRIAIHRHTRSRRHALLGAPIDQHEIARTGRLTILVGGDKVRKLRKVRLTRRVVPLRSCRYDRGGKRLEVVVLDDPAADVLNGRDCRRIVEGDNPQPSERAHATRMLARWRAEPVLAPDEELLAKLQSAGGAGVDDEQIVLAEQAAGNRVLRTNDPRRAGGRTRERRGRRAGHRRLQHRQRGVVLRVNDSGHQQRGRGGGEGSNESHDYAPDGLIWACALSSPMRFCASARYSLRSNSFTSLSRYGSASASRLSFTSDSAR